MATITSTGLGSGVAINDLVTSLVESEGAVKTQLLDIEEAQAQQTISALASLKGALSSFQSSLQALDEADDFQARTATSADSTVFTASADANSVTGSYGIEVEQLATSHKLISTAFGAAEAVGTGTLTLGVGGDSFSLSITASNNTAAGIRDAINNASDNTGVVATIINSDAGAQLVLRSRDTGASNNLTVTVTGDGEGTDTDNLGLSRLFYDGTGSSQLTQLDGANDARVLIDGQLVTSASNVVENAIDGVTLALNKADDNVTHVLSINNDPLAIETKVKDFVDSYNALIELTTDLAKVDNSNGEIGALVGDATLRTLVAQIRRAIGDTVASVTGSFDSLASIGVETQSDNSLKVDGVKLSGAVNASIDDIGELFSNSDGIAATLESIIDNYVEFNGIIDSRTKSLNTDLEEIGEQRETLQNRLDRLEARLFAQFNAMDAIVGAMQGTGSFLDQQLSLLPLAQLGKDS